MPGGRGRIGVIVPANNASLEYDLWRMSPEGVTVHSTRTRPTRGCEPTDPEEFKRELSLAYDLLREVSDVVIYGRTYGTHRHVSYIKEVADLVIPEEAVEKVLRKLGVRRIWIGTPYIKQRTLEEVEYWRSRGFQVTGYDGLNKVKGVDISNTNTFTIYRLVKRHLAEVVQAEAVYIACTALATYDVLSYLHEDLGMPVISENSGAMFEALERLKISHRIPGI
ncbi:maleate cis-trans isomerase family protein [Metallosphaera javensis (ex Sakai et al. 2022)]|uniref:maleate cis-trans isomerase family protein n=1 Tax=Metallosphaera javensis (ex Sakai et al. 2022) TaxID=2775498 RepID=UPI002590CE6F|nr:MAG: arylmalonate decarboxylase [Metallosphaera javensis (ex Sakai et al. 2022)]